MSDQNKDSNFFNYDHMGSSGGNISNTFQFSSENLWNNNLYSQPSSPWLLQNSSLNVVDSFSMSFKECFQDVDHNMGWKSSVVDDEDHCSSEKKVFLGENPLEQSSENHRQLTHNNNIVSSISSSSNEVLGDEDSSKTKEVLSLEPTRCENEDAKSTKV